MNYKMENKSYSAIMDIAKRRGIIYPSFEIYGGVSGFYDYGPVGIRIKQNIERIIRDYFILKENCFEIDSPVLNPEAIWVASGHVENFADKLTQCMKCGEPYRADHLVEEKTKKQADHLGIRELNELIEELGIKCPRCGGKLGEVYDYNLMFHTFIGPGMKKESAYLRPETAQTTYISFRRLWEIGRKKLPLGVFQIGKSFRNEISPRQGMIRLREFYQAEIQFFVDPEKKESDKFDDVKEIEVEIITKDDEKFRISLNDAVEDGVIKTQMIAYFLGRSFQLFERMGINPKRLRFRQHKDDERAFYSSDTWDIEFISNNFGRIELVGISDRTDYDLRAHMELSGQDMNINYNGKKFIPHVIEIAYGIDRPFYCVIESCYTSEKDRKYFRFPEDVAPYSAAVFPLVNKDGLDKKALEVFNFITDNGIYAVYDKSGSIGRRYARADEIGIPKCITIDYETMENDTVTIRDRDTRRQIRVKMNEICKAL